MAGELKTKESREAWGQLLRDAANAIESGDTTGIFIAVRHADGDYGAMCAAKTSKIERDLGQTVAIACDDQGWLCPWEE